MWRRVGQILVWTSALISIASAGLFVLSWIRPSVFPYVFGRTVMAAGVDRGALVAGFSRTEVEILRGPFIDPDPYREQAHAQMLTAESSDQLADWLLHRGWRPWGFGHMGMDALFYVFKIRLVSIPLVAIIALTAIAPSVVLWRRRCRKRRIANHLCLTCGYDLRHSLERCPECGTAVPSTTSGPSIG